MSNGQSTPIPIDSGANASKGSAELRVESQRAILLSAKRGDCRSNAVYPLISAIKCRTLEIELKPDWTRSAAISDVENSEGESLHAVNEVQSGDVTVVGGCEQAGCRCSTCQSKKSGKNLHVVVRERVFIVGVSLFCFGLSRMAIENRRMSKVWWVVGRG